MTCETDDLINPDIEYNKFNIWLDHVLSLLGAYELKNEQG